MQRLWPFIGFAVVVIVHHVLLALDLPSLATKGLLMGSLLIGVLLTGFVTDRVILETSRSRYAFLLLCGGIALSLAGDLGLAVSLETGLLWFSLALAAYVGMLLGPARVRRLPWWSVLLVLVYSPIIAVLWAHLGASGSLIAFYGLLLMALAVASSAVGGLTAVGGVLFLVAEALLGFRMFMPDVLGWFPDPWQDVTISLLYVFAQGFLAIGVLRRLRLGTGGPLQVPAAA